MTDAQRGTPHWAVVQALLNEALAYPPEDRAAWLADLPTEHESVREILRQLLEARAVADGVTFPNTSGAADVHFDSPLSPGELIGPYRLLHELGSGGMGAVWLAERTDGQLRRKYALKLPRMVWAEDLAARMARERDILVSLEHPNIARLYDAGVDDKGRPYLALEYVEGERLDLYCNARKLDIRARIVLFRQVLDAVQYAHTQLIIHRDLKAANVLVNIRGNAVLLDFGIASLVADVAGGEGDAIAQTVSRAMTPRCASPEQLQESRLTLASDVYSLGILLFELLTGELPYLTRSGSRSELEHAIINGDIRIPSRMTITAERAVDRRSSPDRLARALRGDLDAIILKAIQVEPKNRYASVEAFAADLDRWLADQPVQAAHPSRLDRLKKFVRRHTWAVAITSVSAALVLFASAVAIKQSIDAASEAARANATNGFLIGLFDYANPELHAGRDITARELLLEGERRVTTVLTNQPNIQLQILESLTNVWVSIDNLSKARELLGLRTRIQSNHGTAENIVRALVDEADYAFADQDYTAVAEKLTLIRKMPPISQSNYLLASDIAWLNAQLLTRQRKWPAATVDFRKAATLAAKEKDLSREFRATQGMATTAHWLNDQLSLTTAFSRLDELLADPAMPGAEKLRQGTDHVRYAYEHGYFERGLYYAQQLMTISRAVYGEFHSSQIALYLLWLNLTYYNDESLGGVLWLEENNKNILSSSLPDELIFQFRIAALRVTRGANRPAQAATLFETLKKNPTTLPPRAEVRWLLIQAEHFLKVQDIASMRQLVESPEWQRPTNERLDPSWGFFKNWYSGVLLAKERRWADAYKNLNAAYIEGLSRFGERDSLTNLVYLSLIATLEDNQLSRSQLENLFRAYQLLKSSLADDKNFMREVSKIIVVAESKNEVMSMSTRNSVTFENLM